MLAMSCHTLLGSITVTPPMTFVALQSSLVTVYTEGVPHVVLQAVCVGDTAHGLAEPQNAVLSVQAAPL
jgi:hypothetical protein